mmetsp:Transcript_1669/g.3061  ORF Transcript_1669/g.3061 Transcript_1669/m.3061 type:complete len:304 (+) Transcript_1669:8558-9469(+)
MEDNKRTTTGPQRLADLCPHELDSHKDLASNLLSQIRDGLLGTDDGTLIHGGLNSARPLDLIDGQNNLTLPKFDPVHEVLLGVVNLGLVNRVSHGLPHDGLNLNKPSLDVTSRVIGVDELVIARLVLKWNPLVLGVQARSDIEVLLEFQLGNTVKTLLHVRLYPAGFFRLGKDLQKLVVGEEEEARESNHLRLEVIRESLLDDIKLPIGLNEGVLETLTVRGFDDAWFVNGRLHRLPPRRVDRLEELALLRHLAHDIVRGKDGLKIKPGRLHLEPVVKNVLEIIEGLLPLSDAFDERFDETRR